MRYPVSPDTKPGDDLVTLAGRAAVLTAAGHHPYARFAAGMASDLVGLAGNGAMVWCGETPFGLTGHALGDRPALDPVLAEARRRGLLDGLRWINLPRRDAPGPGYALRDNWDFRWSTRPPPPQAGGDRVVALDEDAYDAVDALLDLVMPHSTVRPGRPPAIQWYGVWSDGMLVACGADRSTDSAKATAEVEAVGIIAGIAVHPDHQGRGWGAAVSGTLTARLREAYNLVTLGVGADNEGASRLYERLGYTGVLPVTSVVTLPA
jgi:ribosomal protein S18 acetylase RimI-like enzyme